MTMNKIALLASLALAGTSLSGCATNGRPLTTNQRIAGCTAAMIGGGLLGALIGSQVDGRRGGGTGTGAAIGVALGGAACAVWLAFENEKDRRRLAEAQLTAARTGQPVDESWTGEDGRLRSVSVVPSTQMQSMVPARRSGAGAAQRICRTLSTTPAVDNQSTAPLTSYYCRDEAGNWAPADTAMVAAGG
jgi:hypothetical protein